MMGMETDVVVQVAVPADKFKHFHGNSWMGHAAQLGLSSKNMPDEIELIGVNGKNTVYTKSSSSWTEDRKYQFFIYSAIGNQLIIVARQS
jgi:hypothetical protein